MKQENLLEKSYCRYKTPQAQLHWNPSVWTQIFADKLGRQFGTKKRQLEDSVSKIVVCIFVNKRLNPLGRFDHTVGIHVQVRQEIV